MNIGARIRDAGLEDLDHVALDDIFGIDGGETYRELYYRWEREQWAAATIDFTDDRGQWEKLDERPKKALLSILGALRAGEEQATRTLVPLLDAAPTEEHQVFLATQLVDHARHVVFFDLFYEQVVGHAPAEMELGAAAKLIHDVLLAVSDAVEKDPSDPDVLVGAFLVHHVLVEGTVALTIERSVLEFLRSEKLLPGLRRGLTAIARDGTRHLAFGTSFVREMTSRKGTDVDRIRPAFDDVARPALTVFAPAPGGESCLEALGYGPDEIGALGRATLTKHITAVGL